MTKKILWTDFHSNIHHEGIKELPKWFEQMHDMMDFWPIAYYPFYMRKDECGLGVEDRYGDEEINKDWEYIRQFTKQVNSEGYPMFMGYEWQGAGKDGDHNVFFLNNDDDPAFPLRYADLLKHYSGKSVVAIPHHLAYQIDNRGKNWSTQNDLFSPVAEIYSSHGSSESDDTCITMNRHVHMGPRTGETCVSSGWLSDHQFGVIAAGDNHSCPGVFGYGSTAVIADNNTKESIWEAINQKHTYGVSKERIQMDFKIDDAMMGDTVKANPAASLSIEVVGGDAVDRIEIIKDEKVIRMIPHTSTYEDEPLPNIVRFKFYLEAGWGPDTRVFPDILTKVWHGKVQTSGQIISVEKCWSTFGQKIINQSDKEMEFQLTTHSVSDSGKWMGPSAVTTEGFIIEMEADINSSVDIEMEGVKVSYPITQLLASSHIVALDKEVQELLKSRYGFTEYYRTDPWWHNAYKFKVNRAAASNAYSVHYQETLSTQNCKEIRIRVWQKNGSVAWSSPIFIKQGGRK